MQFENFFTYYRSKLKDRQNTIKQAILTGAAKDWADYRYLTGMLHALAQEEQDLTALLKKTELEDERES